MNKQKWTEMKGTINITKRWAVVPSRQTDWKKHIGYSWLFVIKSKVAIDIRRKEAKSALYSLNRKSRIDSDLEASRILVCICLLGCFNVFTFPPSIYTAIRDAAHPNLLLWKSRTAEKDVLHGDRPFRRWKNLRQHQNARRVRLKTAQLDVLFRCFSNQPHTQGIGSVGRKLIAARSAVEPTFY